MFAMVSLCIFSTAGFAYNVDAWAGITGGKNAITCSAHASTNCSKSDLEGSSYEGYIEEDGREFYQMAGGDQVATIQIGMSKIQAACIMRYIYGVVFPINMGLPAIHLTR